MSENNIITQDTIESNITASLEAPKLDPIHLSVANDYMSGANFSQLATMYNVSEDLISSIITKKEVEGYINSVYRTQGFASRFKRLGLINKVIDAKIEEAEETGVLSKRDLLEWMKFASEEEAKVTPKEKSGPAVAIQVNNYDRLMDDLLKD